MDAVLPAMDLADNPTGCCPRFVPEPWDNQEFSFTGLKFIKAQVKSFFYIPLNMAKVMAETQRAIDAAGASPKERYLMLSKDLSPWKAEHYFLVAENVPGYETVSLSGTYLTKVFEGPYSQMASWFRSLKDSVNARGKVVKSFLAFYTTCPKCAKAYGKNYVVLFAEV